jgi:hypothetical protein
MGLEEGFDGAAQLRVVAAFPSQRRRPLGRRQLGNSLKDALDALTVDRHVGTPVRVVALPCVNGAASCRKKRHSSRIPTERAAEEARSASEATRCADWTAALPAALG